MMNKSEAENLKRELASINAQLFPRNAHIAMEAALSYIEKLEQESAANLQRALVAEKDAARYKILRDGNAYAPEENCVRGGEELDDLCDELIGEKP